LEPFFKSEKLLAISGRVKQFAHPRCIFGRIDARRWRGFHQRNADAIAMPKGAQLFE
jgi:hypothetical protein